VATSGDKFKRRRIDYVLPQRIPTGAVTLFVGKAKRRKTTVSAELVARVSKGDALPGGRKRRPADAFVFIREDAPSKAWAPMVAAAGGNLKRVHFIGWLPGDKLAKQPRLPRDKEEVLDLGRQYKPRLIVLDPCSSFMDRGTPRNEGDRAREFMECLTEIAIELDCGVLAIRHPRKGSKGDADEATSGSMEFFNVPRASLAVGPDPNNPDRYLLATLKHSYGPEAPTLAFTMDESSGVSVVQWEGESVLTADDVLKGDGDCFERSKLDMAKELLKKWLKDGPLPSVEIKVLTARALLSDGTMLRAKRDLGVGHVPKGPNEKRVVLWREPEGGWPS
jgi:hypothetical protein